ncbi:MAG: substrate-binding domain-containing protein [Lachnospiraceae bacterium]|nr:substrate-binding domain-containing protein [Lachnospiraceae bacterium]
MEKSPKFKGIYFRRSLIWFLILTLAVLPLGGCSGKEEGVSPEESQEKKGVQIGLCFDSFVIERWQRDRDIFVSMAKELGAEVNIQNANGDINEQIDQIEYLIDKGMDVIVIICIDPEAVKDSVKKAQEEGIKVISYDRLINGANVDLYISFDNEKVGRLMGKSLVDNGVIGDDVIMICGSPKDNNVHMVERGFESVMKANGNRVIDKVYADGWRAEVASEYVYKKIDIVRRAEAIMCGNDDLASRTVYALSEKRLAGEKLVVGQDADLEACQRIVEGTQLMTVYKPIEKLAQTAAVCAVKLAKNEPMTDGDFKLTTFDDGESEVPYVSIEPIAVTDKNMDEVIIKNGFHLKEDVYLNVPGRMNQK